MKGLINILMSILKTIFSRQVENSSSVSTVSNLAKYNGYKIVIDPGHGGKNGRRDPGAVGNYAGEQVYERDVVLKISITQLPCEKVLSLMTLLIQGFSSE